LRAEGFSCSLDVFNGGQGKSKKKILISKKDIKNFNCIFFCKYFGHQSPASGLDPDPDSLEMLDPQH
jgi:hypothetical protein